MRNLHLAFPSQKISAKSGEDKEEEEEEEEDNRHSREVLNAHAATESNAGKFTMFNLITSTTGERGRGGGGGAKNTNNNNEVALVSSSSQRAANELQRRKNTSNATTANIVFDSIRGDVNLELRTTQTWG